MVHIDNTSIASLLRLHSLFGGEKPEHPEKLLCSGLTKAFTLRFENEKMCEYSGSVVNHYVMLVTEVNVSLSRWLLQYSQIV